jgi:hypothetical protein
MRPMGKILLDLEKLLDEMCDEHDMQFGDIISLVHSHLVIHKPGAREVYVDDGSSPILYYGPEESK